MRMQRQITGKVVGIGLALVLTFGWAGPALADLMTDTEEPFVAGAGIYQPGYTPRYTADEERAAWEARPSSYQAACQGAPEVATNRKVRQRRRDRPVPGTARDPGQGR